FDYRFIIPFLDPCINFLRKFGFHDFLLSDAFNEVWAVVVPPVSDDGHDVGHLQGRDAHFSLPDRERDIESRTPSVVSMAFAIPFGRRQGSAPFSGQVDAEGFADAETHGGLPPQVVSLGGAHTPMIYHPRIRAAVVRVTGLLDGPH